MPHHIFHTYIGIHIYIGMYIYTDSSLNLKSINPSLTDINYVENCHQMCKWLAAACGCDCCCHCRCMSHNERLAPFIIFIHIKWFTKCALCFHIIIIYIYIAATTSNPSVFALCILICTRKKKPTESIHSCMQIQ